MCFRLIDAKKSQHRVSLLCGVLGVSRAGYYAWKDRPASARRRRDDELISQIGQVRAESNGTYGWPRVHAKLRHRGVRVSRKRVARLMRQAGLWGMVSRRKGRATSAGQLRENGVLAYVREALDSRVPEYIDRMQPRPPSFRLPTQADHSLCGFPRGGRWVPFRSGGRAFYLGLYVGKRAPLASVRALQRLVNRMQIDPL